MPRKSYRQFHNGYLFLTNKFLNSKFKMTAICLKAKNSVKPCDWSGVFTSFNTDSKSCLFIKQLTSTCISTILFLRKVLSDDYFEEKNFEGMPLKVLKSRKGDNYVRKIEQWLEGAFEAMEKKYLKRLMLDIKDPESNLTLEIYTMSFNYNKEKNALNPKDSESTTKLNTVKLLQMCYAVTQAYDCLPSQVKLSMRLSYYENTPDDYQPNGYMAWDGVGKPEFPKQPRSIEIGITGTQHHFFKLLNKSCLNENFFKDMENQLENSVSTIAIGAINDTQATERFVDERKTNARRELRFNNSQKNTEAIEDVSPENNKKTSTVKRSETFRHNPKLIAQPVESNSKRNTCKTITKNVKVLNKLPIKGDLKVRCACLASEVSETMFPCLSCRFLVHGECFGILKFDGSKKIRFYCHLCHQTGPNFKCHDKVLISLKNSSDQQVAKQRSSTYIGKVLRYCTTPSVDRITLRKMEKIGGAGVPRNVISVILNKMIEIGVVIPQGRKKNYLIDKQVLANQLVHYFYKVQSSSQSQSQVLPHSLQTSKNILNELAPNRNKPSTSAVQECVGINSQISEESFDIFGL